MIQLKDVEAREVCNVDEVNLLLHNGWLLTKVSSHPKGFVYLLVRD